MLGKSDKNPQLNLTGVPMVHFIDPGHELCRLAGKINWDEVEKDFSGYYSSKGAPSIPVRIMVGLILLKRVYHYSDKNALVQWLENPYWQHFCGQVYFRHKPPFYYSDFSHFRKRIGSEGDKKITELGNHVFGSALPKATKSSGRHSIEPGNVFTRSINRVGNYLIKMTGDK
jgi:transposase, IS5 family